jgi:mono/diheme cytochrome c family protein
MQRLLLQATAALLIGAGLARLQPVSAADPAEAPKEQAAEPADPAASPPAEGGAGAAADLKSPMPPLQRVAGSPKGTLKNPYTDNPQAIEEGRKLFFGKSCNGCHGGGGGGGMCPPLTNTVWVYGDDDDTLFRLISLGSVDLQKAGYSRKGTEGVVGPMPPFGELIDADQDVWKIIAWIRTLFAGDASRRHW